MVSGMGMTDTLVQAYPCGLDNEHTVGIRGDHSFPFNSLDCKRQSRPQPLYHLEMGVEEGSPEMTEIEFPAS